MALQLGALRDALIDAGVKPEKADKASEEVASFYGHLVSVEKALTVLTWMMGASIALTLLVLGGTFALWSKLVEISGQPGHIARAVH